MSDIPSFYSIMPANARYNNKLSPAVKLFYSEISALTNLYGYCNAKNQYFCDLYDVDRRTISRWIKLLENEKFIKVNYSDGQRKIYLSFDSKIQNVDNSVGTALFLGLDGTKMSHPWDKNVPVDFINNIYNKIDLLNKNIYLDNSARQKVEDIVKEIDARMQRKYPGYTIEGQLKSKHGVIMRLIILTLAKSYFDPEIIGTHLANVFVRHQTIVDLVGVFDVANCHGLAEFLVERNAEVKNLKLYILTSLINAHKKQLEKLHKERLAKEREIEYLTDRKVKEEKQLALKKALRGETTQTRPPNKEKTNQSSAREDIRGRGG